MLLLTARGVMKLSKNYEPNQYENDIYDLWEQSQSFQPKGRGKSYSLILPPPNANGDLHLGHALLVAVEDIAIRYHRLRGDRTVFIPGADHAGFETWVVYEKTLAKRGFSRFDFSREQLYQQVWDFVAENRGNFETQLRRFGTSVDWSRYVFSLDENVINLAYKTFKKMWDEKLIYRGERLVNYCTYHGTSFADVEVEYKDEKGSLWYIRYPLTDGSGEIVVATTRPETMFGDTGVAVNPDDKRYGKYINKTVMLPLTNREIPVVTDSSVDIKYGTGAVKITPAHDFNDFEIGQRHKLPSISVITYEGKMSENVPPAFQGLKVLEAREAVVKLLDSSGFLVKSEEIRHSIGHCYKCGTIIEPLLKQQWFVDMKTLSTTAIKSLDRGEIRFYPDSKRTQLITYLSNLKDWNISRQIAWGIPIPAFQNIDEEGDWIYDERVNENLIEVKGKTYKRDPDVFDTWFSSSSWPYATLNYPSGKDYEDFYPLTLMETGGEILYPWVSRMVMLGLYMTGKVPFTNVYIHGYVLAEGGAKMSKSLGNVIDPQKIIDKYGSDALRLGIIAGRVAAVNRGFDIRNVQEARNFCNKLWNVARYVEDRVGVSRVDTVTRTNPSTSADHWILARLSHTVNNVTASLDNYNFAEAYECLYHFVWDDFADWYIEISKVSLNQDVLSTVLVATLKLMHPFAPFLTELIWQTLKPKETLLINADWPTKFAYDPDQTKQFEVIKSIISEVRYIKHCLKINKAELHCDDPGLLVVQKQWVEQLARVKITSKLKGSEAELKLTKIPGNYRLSVDETKLASYKVELNDRYLSQKSVTDRLESRLSNKEYLNKAPQAIVKQSKSQLKEARVVLDNINDELKYFA
jgi:valyl-tRNA synthetase